MQSRQWDFDWNLGAFLGILELTWPPMAQARRGGLGVSKICCSRGLVSHLIGGTGIAMVKPRERERERHTHTQTRDTRTEARESEEGQGGKSPRGDESGGDREARRVGRAKKSEEKKGEPDVRTTNANMHLEEMPDMIGSRGWWPRLIGLQSCGGQVEGLTLMRVLACGSK